MHESVTRSPHLVAGPVLWATVATLNLEQSLAAWQTGLNLAQLDAGTLSEQLAQSYGDPDISGARWVLLGGDTGGVRLIEIAENKAAGGPLASLGWAAIEFSVTDLDLVIEQAVAAGFDLLGRPRALGSNPAIRAAQVAAPGGGVAYLTDIRAYDGPLDLYAARQLVDRVFITVLATDDLDRDRGWLAAEGVGRIVTDRAVAVPVLQKTLGLGADQTTRISSVQLADGCLIEVDAYPADVPSRVAQPGWSPGMMMVTLASNAPLVRGQKCDSAPYHGRLIQIDRLPCGALLERVAA
jgi:hypothetical protein